MSLVLLYNLKLGRTELSVGNTSPFYRGFKHTDISKIILGDSLEYVDDTWNAWNLYSTILANFRKTGERVFLIMTPATRFNVGHSFNAVVTGNDKKAEVIFVDAWYKRTYTNQELMKKYNKDWYRCTISNFPGPITPLVEPTHPESSNLIHPKL